MAAKSLKPNEMVAITTLERQILMELFFSTHGRNWTNKDNWGSNEPVSSWYGVQVDEYGRVSALTLDGNNLQGLFIRLIFSFRKYFFKEEFLIRWDLYHTFQF